MDQPIFQSISPYMSVVMNVLYAAAIFVGGWILSKIIARMVMSSAERSSVDTALARFFSSLARYGILAATLIASLGMVGIKTTSLVAVMAAAGFAIGMALQGNLANFASGVMLLFFRPINLNDVITAGGHTGRVEDIGIFATTLINPANQKIIVPNSKVTGDAIINLTVLGTRRGQVDVGVAYGTDINTAREVLLAAATRVELVLDDPAPAVAVTGLGASSVDFAIFAWTEAPDYLAMLDALRQSVYEGLNEAGIEIPFNQLVIHKEG